jgi:eukaryotic-like serine/threonine-protein kinase
VRASGTVGDVGISQAPPPHVVGRYALYGEIATGGMASVHYGRLLGPAGFSRTVAIKRLHPHLARDREFTAMFLDEARLAARVSHPNVVPMLDVVELADEVLLVMEYVPGATLTELIRASIATGALIPPDIAAAIVSGVLHGLHAAHEATDEAGAPLGMVHRDVSPQNVQIGVDGVPRVLDFGVAKAEGRMQTTRDGQLKGKLAYMPPEQLRGTVDRRTDVYAASVILWETLASRRLFTAENDGAIVTRVLEEKIEPPSAYAPAVPRELCAITLRGLDRDPSRRFPNAREMALAIEARVSVAKPTRVARWVEELAGETLKQRATEVAGVENASTPALPWSRSGPGTRSDEGTMSAIGPSAGTLRPPEPAAAATRGRRTRLAVACILALGAAVLFGGSRLLGRRSPGSAVGPSPSATVTAGRAPGLPAKVIVLGIENRTSDPIFDGTLDAVLASALGRCSGIVTYSNDRLNVLADVATQRVDEEVARRIAERDGETVVTIRGVVGYKGTDYSLSVTAKDARAGAVIFATALDGVVSSRVVPTVGRVACQLRAALGDSPPTEPELAEQTGLSTSVEADHEFTIGRGLARSGKYPEGIEHLRHAVTLDPRFGQAHVDMAIYLRNLGRISEGNGEVRLALEGIGALSDRERLRFLGYSRAAEEDYRDSAAAYEELLRMFPDDERADTALPGLYQEMWDSRRSLDLARSVFARHPDSVFNQTNLATSELFAGNLDTAASVARKVLETNPNPLPHAYSDLAIAEALSGHAAEAREAYTKLMARDASLAAAGLADLALAEGRLDEAAKLLEAGIVADRAQANASAASVKWAMLAETRALRGDRPGALAASKEATFSATPSVTYVAATASIAAGDPKGALALAASLAGVPGQDHAMWSKLIEAEALLAQGKAHDAMDRIEEAQRVVDSWPGHASLARAHRATLDLAQAESELRICLARQGEGALAFGPNAPSVRMVSGLRSRATELVQRRDLR